MSGGKGDEASEVQEMVLSNDDAEVPRGMEAGSRRHEEGNISSFEEGKQVPILACKKKLHVSGGFEQCCKTRTGRSNWELG